MSLIVSSTVSNSISFSSELPSTNIVISLCVVKRYDNKKKKEKKEERKDTLWPCTE